MKTKVYSVFDKTAAAFTAPFFLHNDGLAIRAFADNINSDQENTMSKHYEQFALYCIGEWDDKLGDIDKQDPVCVISGLEVKEPTQENQLMEEIKVLKDLIIKGN